MLVVVYEKVHCTYFFCKMVANAAVVFHSIVVDSTFTKKIDNLLGKTGYLP